MNNAEWAHYRQLAKVQPLLAAQDERELLIRAKRGERRAVNGLVTSHMRLVVQIAGSYAREGLSAHDLIAEGTLGLLEAIERFELDRPARFASYAAWWVRASVRQHALENRRIVGMPDSRGARVVRARLRTAERKWQEERGERPTHEDLAHVLGVSVQDVALVDAALSHHDVMIGASEHELTYEPRDEGAGPEETLAEAETRWVRERFVREALATLSERERKLVCEHLYCDDGSVQSLADLGRALGVSRQRAGQILETARQKLRARLSHAHVA